MVHWMGVWMEDVWRRRIQEWIIKWKVGLDQWKEGREGGASRCPGRITKSGVWARRGCDPEILNGSRK